MKLSNENIEAVDAALSRVYGNPRHGNKLDPFDELLFILCSQKTQRRGYERAYSDLRKSFPTRSSLAAATQDEIAQVLKPYGLSRQKAGCIRAAIERTQSTFDRVTLSPLRSQNDEACERFLTSIPGIGKKVARCVMLYSLGRCVFPVDTHCWRVSRRLGWVRRTRPDGSCSPRDMDRLQAKIPADQRYTLHVNLVAHGRLVCTARNPACEACPISRYCQRVGVAKQRP